jgi:conjugal transfer pilus assembly protein TraL
MTEDQLRLMIPRRLDETWKVLFWDSDVAFVFLFGIFIGVMSGFVVTAFFITIVLTYVYSKAKSGQARGYAMHLLYWNLPSTLGMKRTPLSARREFVG